MMSMKKFWINSLRSMVLVSGIASLCPVAHADKGPCDESWRQLSTMRDEQTPPPNLISFWESVSPECQRTGFFHHKLGWLQIFNTQFELAINTFKKGVGIDDDYKPELELALADAHYQRWASWSADSGGAEYLETAELLYSDLIKRRPAFYAAHMQMAALKLAAGDDEAAIFHAQNAVSLQENPFSYRNLVIALRNTGSYERAIDAYRKVVEIAPEYRSDVDMMLSAAVAYAESNQYEQALETLRTLVAVNSTAKPDPEFQRTVKYITNKLKQQR